MDRENSNRIKQEEGALAVARIKAQAQNVSISAPTRTGARPC